MLEEAKKNSSIIPPQILKHGPHTLQVCKLIGKGGFANCYIAVDVKTSRQYALKTVHLASLTSDQHRTQLVSEINIHTLLDHRNIVKCYQTFSDEKFTYLIIELCVNGTLSSYLNTKRGRLTENEAKLFFWMILCGIKYLHDYNIIHRDLKLSNIFLDSGLEAKIGDFGLATILTHGDDRKWTLCGTPNYIAPEVFSRKHKKGHGKEVDMWALGVILYTMLIGKPPFQESGAKETLKRIKSVDYAFPPDIELTSHAQSLISSLLVHDPEERAKLEQIQSHPFLSDVIIKSKSLPPLHQLYQQQGTNGSMSGSIISDYKSEHGSKSSIMESIRSELRASNETSDKNSKSTWKGSYEEYKPYLSIPEIDESQTINRKNSDPKSGEYVSVNSENGSMRSPEMSKYSDYNECLGPESIGGHEQRWEASISHQEHKKIYHGSHHKQFVDETPLLNPFNTVKKEYLPSFSFNKIVYNISCLFDPKSPIPEPTLENFKSGELIYPYYIVKYIDCRSKFGMGYLLSDGTIGMLFNDNTHLILSASHTAYYYLEKLDMEIVYNTYLESNIPEKLHKKKTIVGHIVKSLGYPPVPKNVGYSQIEEIACFVPKYLAKNNTIIFRLSNATAQIFSDGSEDSILLFDNGRVFTYILPGETKHSTMSLSDVYRHPYQDRIGKVLYRFIEVASNP